MAEHELRSGDLVKLAAAHDEAVSPRSLELWRYRGLLPRPGQRAGRAVWVYPPGTDRQLLRLLHWRRHTSRHDVLRIALWAEGFPIDPELVREDLMALVDAYSDRLRLELGVDDGEDIGVRIDGLARQLAAMRGRFPLPRVVRMTRRERERALGYMLAAFTGDAEQQSARADDRILFERMLGLRRGQAWRNETVVPLPPDWLEVATDPVVLRTALRNATPLEFEMARRAIRLVRVVLPFALPRMLRDEPNTVALHELFHRVLTDFPPQAYAGAAVALVVSIHGNETPPAALAQYVRELGPSNITPEIVARQFAEPGV